MKKEQKMKAQKNLFKIGIAVALTSLASTAVNAATEPGDASATVVEPLTITENTSINFGSLAGGASTGTVLLTTGGARTATGGVDLIGGGTEVPGDFNISGEPNAAFTLTVGTTATLNDGANNMAVVGINSTAVGATLDGTGSQDFLVGGTLNVGINQAAGTYTTATGTPYTVTVEYN
jgi:hypothetical protein